MLKCMKEALTLVTSAPETALLNRILHRLTTAVTTTHLEQLPFVLVVHAQVHERASSMARSRAPVTLLVVCPALVLLLCLLPPLLLLVARAMLLLVAAAFAGAVFDE